MPASTPRDRLLMALQMADLGEQMVRARLARDHPELDEHRVRESAARWRRDRPDAPHGDCPGRRSTRRLEQPDR
ncbi:MAG: hypothetical protein IPK37_06330 [Austwickia sp.]|nr:MAG: hypothetical protein IPK37_06330 [Austwickia sp.]